MQVPKILGTRSLADVNKHGSAELLSQSSALICLIIFFCCSAASSSPFITEQGQLGEAGWQRRQTGVREKDRFQNRESTRKAALRRTWEGEKVEHNVKGPYSWKQRHKAMRSKLWPRAVFCRVRLVSQSRKLDTASKKAGWKSYISQSLRN